MYCNFTSMILINCTVNNYLFRDPDEIHNMMDDIEEQNELAEEIQAITSRPIGGADEFDDVSSSLHVHWVISPVYNAPKPV